MARPSNNFKALATHFKTGESILDLADALASAGGAWTSNTRGAVLQRAGSHGTPADIVGLAERGYDLSTDTRPIVGDSVLHVAASFGNHLLVEHLIKIQGMDPDWRLHAFTKTPMDRALENMNSTVVDTLLGLGASSQNAWGQMVIHGSRLLAAQNTPARGQGMLDRIIGTGDVLARTGVDPIQSTTTNDSAFFLLLDNLIMERPWTWSKLAEKLAPWGFDLADAGVDEALVRGYTRNNSVEHKAQVDDLLRELQARQMQARLERDTTAASGPRTGGLRL